MLEESFGVVSVELFPAESLQVLFLLEDIGEDETDENGSDETDETVEQEATLCLAVLMGYNVSMYANSDDEKKKQFMLERSKYILSQLPHSQLRTRLLYCCLRFVNQK